MKKWTFCGLLCVLAIVGCHSIDGSYSGLSLIDSSHNARNSLDFIGRYEVQVQVSGDDIREVQLEDDGRYFVTLANGINISGQFVWNVPGNQVILNIKKQKWIFFVGENFLKLISSGFQEGRIFQKF